MGSKRGSTRASRWTVFEFSHRGLIAQTAASVRLSFKEKYNAINAASVQSSRRVGRP